MKKLACAAALLLMHTLPVQAALVGDEVDIFVFFGQNEQGADAIINGSFTVADPGIEATGADPNTGGSAAFVSIDLTQNMLTLVVSSADGSGGNGFGSVSGIEDTVTGFSLNAASPNNQVSNLSFDADTVTFGSIEVFPFGVPETRTFIFDITTSVAIPLPATAWLMLAGLGGLAALRTRRV
ncbi:MAG: VPLPA-CTERM sorting domain-containing protein [Pseudomonadota bacterium]